MLSRPHHNNSPVEPRASLQRLVSLRWHDMPTCMTLGPLDYYYEISYLAIVQKERIIKSWPLGLVTRELS